MLHLIYYAIVGVAAGVAALIGATLMKDVQHRVAAGFRSSTSSRAG